ncbi:homeobox protein HMX1-like protein [Lates japonicus]|uniref:Homeobox protein HMX1-like protein n=1 Tax=Lates japonicus TaxID=270547 RepID=A0AAD3NIR0_LATJO|nr:homeobox protein HMX1-like protein [Lates japonicus]
MFKRTTAAPCDQRQRFTAVSEPASCWGGDEIDRKAGDGNLTDDNEDARFDARFRSKTRRLIEKLNPRKDPDRVPAQSKGVSLESTFDVKRYLSSSEEARAGSVSPPDGARSEFGFRTGGDKWEETAGGGSRELYPKLDPADCRSVCITRDPHPAQRWVST